MEHIRPLVIKYIYTAAITVIFLSYLLIPAVPPGSSLVIALAVALVLYFLGDRILLPRFGILPTAIANFIMAAVVLALATSFLRQATGTGVILATAAVTGVAEWIFYRYVRGEIGAALEGEISPPSNVFGDGEHLPESDESGGGGENGQEG